ncbi:MAG: EamA family transporter [Pyrobaculum arsenaticum]|uniref:EamA domain-containing protein n=2 Tax=Pyrobaculum arsenaticum TaxID=121277 RepID=A4WI46_PYRAR|nr:EamA family transporter [Pyrobaculum arsenaticum]ABP50063.1 protein of unknown function DUF6, transmembrane [Pyrobaculum arsenaticum DSM 13514]MCY0889655.1 EamA family transporter [Pyrobaculum arsenaticum]NYR14968.1 EamA family transporter [Pyrobaculum arsenaticum]
MTLNAYAKITAAAALWSTLGVAASLGGDLIWLAFYRSIFAAVLSLAIAKGISRRGVVPGLFLGALFTTYPIAAVYAGVGPAAYLLYTAPLWTTLVLLPAGERPNKWGAVAVALVLAAVAVMLQASASGELSAIGLVAGLASGLFYGLYIATARLISKRGGAREASYGAMPYTVSVTAPVLLYHAQMNHAFPTASEILAGAYMGVLGTVLPYSLFASAVEKVEGSRASVVASSEPVLAALWGYLLFGQAPGPLTLVAYILLTAAAVIASKK